MKQDPASYRDNDGYVFEQEGKVYRFVHPGYFTHYDHLMSSGLYDELTKKGWLITHTALTDRSGFGELPDGKILLPQQLPFISYPYEWCFDQWKDAALLTLRIAEAALEKGMVLKDAGPFNVQFNQGGPLFIDTLSFELYKEGEAWIAYRQFCESFLAPLLLMHYCHPSTNKFFTVFPNGIPLDLLVSLLPKSSRWNLNTYLHIHLQAKLSANRKNDRPAGQHFSKKKMQVLLQGLLGFVNKLTLKKTKTNWDDYYTDSILGNTYLEQKSALVSSFLGDMVPGTVIDLGANDGHFSLLLKNKAALVIAADADPNCINALYLQLKTAGIKHILPMIADLTAPSPAIGWNNTERAAVTTRWKADLVMALALVHHLAITHNIPLQLIAEWLHQLGPNLLIEFVPKEDEKVQLLLQNREDIFPGYSLPEFKKTFSLYYDIIREARIGDTPRTLLLMKRK